jgi:hypothetical protein
MSRTSRVLNVRLTQGVAHHVIGVVVDVFVRRAVDIEDVSAPLALTGGYQKKNKGGGESGLDLFLSPTGGNSGKLILTQKKISLVREWFWPFRSINAPLVWIEPIVFF